MLLQPLDEVHYADIPAILPQINSKSSQLFIAEL